MNVSSRFVLHVVLFLVVILGVGFAGCNDERVDAQGIKSHAVSRLISRGAIAEDRGSGERKFDGNGDAPRPGLPIPVDYGAPGPFDDAMMIENTGPDGDYTLSRPGASLGRHGFKHPIVSWGNGIITTPTAYETTLTFLATHGFVVIASNSRKPERPLLAAGLDWLIARRQLQLPTGDNYISPC